MQQTSNYGIKKPESTDAVNIDDINGNFDVLDSELKKVSDKANYIQTAGGTGTAITLNNTSLTNGFTITFIAAADNSGAATTINGKDLYKPGGTSAPTLTAGKAITVWYNGTNFFIKASAEGDAVAANVLAGKVFSNEEETGMEGTIPSKAAQTYTPTTTDQTIAASQYLTGVQTISGDADLVTGNIRAGINIFGVAGKTSVVDTADATAVAANILAGVNAYINGVKTTGTMVNKAGTTTTAPTAAATGQSTGYIDITVPAAAYYDTAAKLRIYDADFVATNIKVGTNAFGVAGSVVEKVAVVGEGSASGTAAAALAKGAMTKIVRSFGMDQPQAISPNTAPGSAPWEMQFDNSGTYLIMATYATPFMAWYKKVGDTYTKLANPAVIPAGPNGRGACFSGDSTYCAIACERGTFSIYKRSGDTLTKLANPTTMPSNSCFGVAMNYDGSMLAVGVENSSGLWIYKRSGDTYTFAYSVPSSYSGDTVRFSPDGQLVSMCTIDGSARIFIIGASSATLLTTISDVGQAHYGEFSYDGKYYVVSGSSSPYFAVYALSGSGAGTTFSKLANPASLPTKYCQGVGISRDNQYIAVVCINTPSIFYYKRTGTTLALLSTPTTNPGASGGISATWCTEHFILGFWNTFYAYKSNSVGDYLYPYLGLNDFDNPCLQGVGYMNAAVANGAAGTLTTLPIKI